MNRIIEAIERRSVETPAACALVFGQSSLSCAALSHRVDRVASWLMGTGANTVAFRVDNGIDWVVMDLAIMKLGLTSIPVPTFFTEQQLLHVIDDAAVDTLIMDQSLPAQALEPALDGVRASGDVPFAPGLTRFAIGEGAASGQRGLKITYTSGSTGTPKGVCLTHETLSDIAMSIVGAMASVEVDRHLCVLPLATLLENVAGLYAPLVRGVVVHVPGLDELGVGSSSLDVEKFSSIVSEVRPDSLILVPQLLTALVALVQYGLIDAASFTMVAVGGGRVSEHLLNAAQEVGVPVYQGYGLSECGSVVALNLPHANRPGSVGKALPHARIRTSESGEIEVGGPRMKGYLGDSTPDVEWFRTGDLGRIDRDGYVYIDGRARNVFITAFGRNVNPEWVEAALTQQPAISQALVHGESRAANTALLWLRFPQSGEQVQALVDAANAELPDYARVHHFIVMGEPLDPAFLTANGRLKRGRVEAHFADLIDNHYTRLPQTPNNIHLKDQSHAVLQ